MKKYEIKSPATQMLLQKLLVVVFLQNTWKWNYWEVFSKRLYVALENTHSLNLFHILVLAFHDAKLSNLNKCHGSSYAVKWGVQLALQCIIETYCQGQWIEGTLLHKIKKYRIFFFLTFFFCPGLCLRPTENPEMGRRAIAFSS